MSTLPLLVLFFASLVSASTPPSDTIVSIKSGSADVDIRRLPEMLRNAGVIPDQKIVSFLDTVEITALEYVHSQVVQTSASAIDSDALCKFVTVASSKLSLQSECGEDENGEVLDEFDDDLHVDDPDARYQKHWKWMDMGEVWQLALPHVTREVKVAVLDSGIDWADPDFAPLKRTLKKKSGGYLDGGWNFFTNSANLTYGEPHGTKVCKVLAAKGNNSAGIAGFAPFNVSLTLLQMIDDKRRLPLSRFLAALNMAIDLEVDVVSMSLKYEFHIRNHPLYILIYNALRSAQQHNMLLVSAAANDAREASYVYRCWFGGPRSMCVAPLSDDRTENTLAGFSNWGERVDVAAYGVGIFTDRWENGTERNFYGTSAATPVVSGIAAILLSMNIEPGMVKRLIDAKSDPISFAPPRSILGGALNALNTVQHAIHILQTKLT